MVRHTEAPAPERLRALARKYRTLTALRARRDGGGPVTTREELRALAAEFPGCLRELDTLGPAELARRSTACEAAGRATHEPGNHEPATHEPGIHEPGTGEPWMAWIDAYHGLMRQALAVRAERARGRARAGQDDFAGSILTPPDGRMSIVVLRALATRFEVPAAEIAAALFPARRPPPYQL